MVNSKSRGDSFKCANWDFKQAFPLAGRGPCKSTIWRQKKKFDKEGIFERKLSIFFQTMVLGTVLNLNPGRSGRKPTALTAPNIQMVQDLLNGLF